MLQMSVAHPAGKRRPQDRARQSSTVEVDGELRPGQAIGEYQIGSKLGQGGMALVYAATQPVIGKRVAINVISRQLCVDPVSVDRFVQEARAVSSIRHPNIVDIF